MLTGIKNDQDILLITQVDVDYSSFGGIIFQLNKIEINLSDFMSLFLYTFLVRVFLIIYLLKLTYMTFWYIPLHLYCDFTIKLIIRNKPLKNGF